MVISVRQLASIKRTFQNVQPMLSKRRKLEEKIEEIQKEIEDLNLQIDSWENAVKNMTGGFSSADLVSRIVTPIVDEYGNQKVNNQGNPQVKVTYEASPLLVYSKENNGYTLVKSANDILQSNENNEYNEVAF